MAHSQSCHHPNHPCLGDINCDTKRKENLKKINEVGWIIWKVQHGMFLMLTVPHECPQKLKPCRKKHKKSSVIIINMFCYYCKSAICYYFPQLKFFTPKANIVAATTCSCWLNWRCFFPLFLKHFKLVCVKLWLSIIVICSFKIGL